MSPKIIVANKKWPMSTVAGPSGRPLLTKPLMDWKPPMRADR